MSKAINIVKGVGATIFASALVVGAVMFAVNQTTIQYMHLTKQDKFSVLKLDKDGITCVQNRDPMAAALYCGPSGLFDTELNESGEGDYPRCGTEVRGKTCIDDVGQVWWGEDA